MLLTIKKITPEEGATRYIAEVTNEADPSSLEIKNESKGSLFVLHPEQNGGAGIHHRHLEWDRSFVVPTGVEVVEIHTRFMGRDSPIACYVLGTAERIWKCNSIY